MFHSSVFALVLTLAAAPAMPVWCQVWCHPPVAASCQHGDPAPTAISGEDCDNVVVGAVPFVREDTAGRLPAPDTDQALTGPAFRPGPLTRYRASGEGGVQPPALDARSHLLALRI